MADFTNLFSLNEWIQFAVLIVSVMALIISMLAYRRAGNVVDTTLPTRQMGKNTNVVKPILERYKSIDVSLMLTAKRNAQNQLRLIIKNTGAVTAKDIDLVIGEPIRIINKEELTNGISDTIEVTNPALRPRLTVIDEKTIFPIAEVLPGVIFDIIAITTMGYGKICDFPISISWLDDRGTRHFQDEVVTI